MIKVDTARVAMARADTDKAVATARAAVMEAVTDRAALAALRVSPGDWLVLDSYQATADYIADLSRRLKVAVIDRMGGVCPGTKSAPRSA